MNVQVLRRKDVFKGEMLWGDIVCDLWIFNWEIVFKWGGVL